MTRRMGKPYAENPHVKFYEGDIAPVVTPMRRLLCKRLARLACALAAMAVMPRTLAVEVTPEQARMAARNWIGKSPTRMTAKFASSDAVDVQTSKNADGRALYHVVKLSGDGYVVTAGDTELPPVIAFSESGILNLDDSGNPLLALLERDMGRRIGLVDGGASKIKQSQGVSPFEAEWAELTGSAENRVDGKAAVLKESLSSLSDVRVAPLVQSKWGQSLWNGYNTFNYYTPNNYVCGCVATALAQIMRYWQRPTSSVSARSYYCKVDGSNSYRTMNGGTYNWSNMPLVSSSCTSDTQREAIGKLTYDLGVASQMKWTSSGSGTMGFAGSQALKNAFGYVSSQAYFDITGFGLVSELASQTAFRDAILASLDAGMPCAVGVAGDEGGHEMVLDGYGFSGSVIYSHINCGWNGSEDAWYNFFGEYVTTYSYAYMDELGYNIHPTESGDVLSGRVLNSSGNPVSGAAVTLTKNGVTKTTTTNSKGIYAFRITSSGTYTVSATYSAQSGSTTATVSTMSESTTAVLDSNCNYSTSASNGTLGNSWGNDLTLGGTTPSGTPTATSVSIGTYGNGANTSYIKVEWTNVAAATSYSVYRSTTNTRPSSPIVTGVTSTYYYDYASTSGLTPGVKYYYWVESVNSAGSSFSNSDWGNILVSVSLNQSTLGFTAAGGTSNITVTANTSWSATKSDSWLSLSTSGMSGNGSIAVTAAPNTTSAGRTGRVIVTAGAGTSYPKTVTNTVTQSANASTGTYAIKFNRMDYSGTTLTYTFNVGIAQPLPRLWADMGWSYSEHEFLGWATNTYSSAQGQVGEVVYADGASVKDLVANGETAFLYAVWTTTSTVNDDFASATRISGKSGSIRGSTVGATSQSGEPLISYSPYATNTIWWAWTASASGNVTFSTTNTAFDTVMGIYTGTSVSSLTTIRQDDDGGPNRTSICTFAATQGVTYYIAVSGYGNSNQGTIRLDWSLVESSQRCTVVFNPNGGTLNVPSMATRQVEYGAEIGSLPDVSRTGYEYAGWFPAVAGGVRITYRDIVTSNMTAYAHWTANTYSVTYALDGGTHGATHPTTATYDTAFYVSAPTKSGYTFTGWTVTSGLNTSTAKWGTSSNPSTTISSSSTKCVNGATGNVYFKNLTPAASGSVTLAANWSANTYMVALDSQGGSGGTASVTATYGSPMPSITVPTRTGYTFGGYYTGSNGSGTLYIASSGTSARTWDIASATTLYAHWTAKTYSVSYSLDGGTHGTTHPSSATYDTAFYVSAPTRVGYTFTGWTVTSGLDASTAKWGTTSSPFTSLTSSTTKCANGATGNVYFKNLRSTSGSVTLTASWQCSHSSTYVRDARVATCTEAGYTGDTVCSACGATIATGSAIPALGHQEGAGVVTQEPTATAEGVMTYSCTRCGVVMRTEAIPVVAAAVPDLGFATFTDWNFGYYMFTTEHSDGSGVFSSAPVRLFDCGERFSVVYGYANFGDAAISDAAVTTLYEMEPESGASVSVTSDSSLSLEPRYGSQSAMSAGSWTGLPAGVYTARVTLDSGNALSDTNRSNNVSSFVFAIRDPVALGPALGCSALVLGTNGDDWYGTRDGADPAVSYARTKHLGNYGTNVLSAAISGAGTLSFDWKVSSEPGYDWLEFLVDGVVTNRISGTNCVWQSRTYELADGSHAVEWRYRKDGSYYDGLDCAWLANVEWTPRSNTVTLDANGGSVSGQPSVSFPVEEGKYTNQAGASRTVSRSGYSLVGWYDTIASSGGNMVFDARGYAVKGKYWDGAYSPKVSAAKWKFTGNVTAYARWVKTPPYRVVTFDANGGTVSNAAYAAVVVEDGKATMQAGASGTKAARAGYSLVGWFDTTNSAGGNAVFDARGYAVNGKYWNGAYSPKVSAATWKHSGNVVAYARWVKAPPYRVVTFDANGGAISNAAVVVENGKSTSQAGASGTKAARVGYALVGWFDTTNSAGGNAVFDARGYAVNGKYWDGAYSPKASAAAWKHTGNVVAYARWVRTPPCHVVTFDANGGAIGDAAYASVVVEDGKATMQAGASGTKAVRAGYTLVGWFDTTNSAGGNAVFDARGYAVNGKYWDGAYSPKASAAAWKFAGNVVAYARWVRTPPYRVVTFDANGGAIGDAAYAAVVVEDSKATMQAGASGTKAARAGYTLVGWFDTTNSAGGNAVFDARGYAVNGKYWDGAYDPGKTAAKWKFSGNVTAYARWIVQEQPGKYTATLNANGGSIGGQPFLSAQTEYGKYTNQAAANRTVMREGYSLAGWFDADGNMVFDARGYAVNGKYWDGAYSPKVSSAKWKYAGNVVAYARWVKTPPYRVVTFDANGGTISNATYAAVVVEDGKYTMQAGASGTKVARAFYTLVGWFDTTNATGGNAVFDARGYAVAGKYWNGTYEPGKTSATWKYAGNVVAYARWTPAKYTVTLNANGGSVSGQPTVAVQVEYGRYTSQAGANRSVERSGHKLVGWYDTSAASGGNIVFDARGYAVSGKYWNGSYEPGKTSATWKYAGNVVAYARWAQVSNKYTVTLNANGGTVDGQPGVSFQVEIGKSTGQAGAKRSVERSGYMLLGWYDMDGNIVFDAMGYAVDGKYWDGEYWPNYSSATWKYAGNVTAYARWIPMSSNIKMASSGDMENDFGLGGFGEDAPPFFQGEFVGMFADDGGMFMLTLDEGLETAYFVTWTDDGGVACECEAAVAGDVLILTTETGEVYHLVWKNGGLVATRME